MALSPPAANAAHAVAPGRRPTRPGDLDRGALEIRSLERTDRDGLAAAFERLSSESRYQRFLSAKPRLSAAELDNLTHLDHVTRDAVIAIERATGRLVGVARYALRPGAPATAEVQGVTTQLARAPGHACQPGAPATAELAVPVG